MRQKLPKQAEVQLLVNAVMPWAEAELQKKGRFVPAAAWLLPGASEPEFHPVETSDAPPALSMEQQEATLTADIRRRWQIGEVAAAVVVAPVLYGRSGSGSAPRRFGCMWRPATATAPTYSCHTGYAPAEDGAAALRTAYTSAIRWRRRAIRASAARPRRPKETMPTKRKSKGAYMISAVAEMYEIHPQTLRLYEREGLLKPSRTEGNTRLYTDEDLERLEFILNLARDLGVNIAGIAIILQMRERMEEMNRQMQSFVDYVRTEMLQHIQQNAPVANEAAMVPLRKPAVIDPPPLASANGSDTKVYRCHWMVLANKLA